MVRTHGRAFEVTAGGESLEDFRVDPPPAAPQLLNKRWREVQQRQGGRVDIGAVLSVGRSHRTAVTAMRLHSAAPDQCLALDPHDAHGAVGPRPVHLRQIPQVSLPIGVELLRRGQPAGLHLDVTEEFRLVLLDGEYPLQTELLTHLHKWLREVQRIADQDIDSSAHALD